MSRFAFEFGVSACSSLLFVLTLDSVSLVSLFTFLSRFRSVFVTAFASFLLWASIVLFDDLNALDPFYFWIKNEVLFSL